MFVTMASNGQQWLAALQASAVCGRAPAGDRKDNIGYKYPIYACSAQQVVISSVSHRYRRWRHAGLKAIPLICPAMPHVLWCAHDSAFFPLLFCPSLVLVPPIFLFRVTDALIRAALRRINSMHLIRERVAVYIAVMVALAIEYKEDRNPLLGGADTEVSFKSLCRQAGLPLRVEQQDFTNRILLRY